MRLGRGAVEATQPHGLGVPDMLDLLGQMSAVQLVKGLRLGLHCWIPWPCYPQAVVDVKVGKTKKTASNSPCLLLLKNFGGWVRSTNIAAMVKE